MAVANGRKHFRCRGMARHLRAALLVFGKFRPLRRHLWVSWAGIGLMMWMWVSSIVILFGAQLNSEIEHQTAKDLPSNGTGLWERGAR